MICTDISMFMTYMEELNMEAKCIFSPFSSLLCLNILVEKFIKDQNFIICTNFSVLARCRIARHGSSCMHIQPPFPPPSVYSLLSKRCRERATRYGDVTCPFTLRPLFLCLSALNVLKCNIHHTGLCKRWRIKPGDLLIQTFSIFFVTYSTLMNQLIFHPCSPLHSDWQINEHLQK